MQQRAVGWLQTATIKQTTNMFVRRLENEKQMTNQAENDNLSV
jgi:hypothetical protein